MSVVGPTGVACLSLGEARILITGSPPQLIKLPVVVIRKLRRQVNAAFLLYIKVISLIVLRQFLFIVTLTVIDRIFLALFISGCRHIKPVAVVGNIESEVIVVLKRRSVRLLDCYKILLVFPDLNDIICLLCKFIVFITVENIFTGFDPPDGKMGLFSYIRTAKAVNAVSAGIYGTRYQNRGIAISFPERHTV